MFLSASSVCHHSAVANADPVKPINGKKLVLVCGVGAILFTGLMGIGTYLLAKVMTPMLAQHNAKSSAQGAIPAASEQKPSK